MLDLWNYSHTSPRWWAGRCRGCHRGDWFEKNKACGLLLWEVCEGFATGAPEHKSVCGSKLVLGAKGGVVEGEKVSAWGAPDGAGPWKCTLHWWSHCRLAWKKRDSCTGHRISV